MYNTERVIDSASWPHGLWPHIFFRFYERTLWFFELPDVTLRVGRMGGFEPQHAAHMYAWLSV